MAYVSRGTISVKFNLNNDRPTSLYFIPERDYSIKHGEKDYAIFIPSVQQGQDNSIFKGVEGHGVEIAVDVPAFHQPRNGGDLDRQFIVEVAKKSVDRLSFIAFISALSERHSRVEVVVNRNLELTGITVLAR